MTSRIEILNKEKLLNNPPKFLTNNLIYETITGSFSYGVSSDTSDMDIIGVTIPPKEYIFPHLDGHIANFGTPPKKFDSYQQHHIKRHNKSYDVTVYGLVKWFQLVMENNPNMLDSLFVKRNSILHINNIGEYIRDNRKEFLHKGSYHKLMGYSFSQLSKMRKMANSSNPARKEDMEKYGYSTKFAYHIVRLVLQGEQILMEHDLDLHANINILKSIRNGEWTAEKIYEWFDTHEKSGKEKYDKSTLRDKPDEKKIKEILMNCIEMKYGSISESVYFDNGNLVNEIKELVKKYE